MKENIHLLFGILPNENLNEITKNSKGNVQFAADTLQKALINGFSAIYEDVKIINVPYIGSYPFYYNKIIYSSKKKCNNFIDVSFCNLVIVKNFFRLINAFRYLRLSLNNSLNNTIVIYALHTPFLLAAFLYKKKHRNTKLCIIVPDLLLYNGSKLPRWLINVHNSFQRRLLNSFDCFVILSDYMKEELPIGNKPFAVVEGIFDDCSMITANNEKTDKYRILYTGTFAKRYGIISLIKAFSLLKDDNYELLLCGHGDGLDFILEAAKNDNRIKYLGQISHDEVLKLQTNVDLLVNPRIPDHIFTKYSFPSKTMEYFASGTPCLLYKLPGIPKEYFNYCYTLDCTSIESLAYKIEDILKYTSFDDRVKLGQSARDFILRYKNPIVQCEKIKQLLNKI